MRKRILATIGAGLLAASSLTLSGPAKAGSGDAVTLGAAAYFTDGDQWSRLLATPNLSYIVVNTNYGVGGYIAQAVAKGIKVFGYTPAGYAPLGANSINAKSLTEVENNISSILGSNPSLAGIFLDEILNIPCASNVSSFYAPLMQWYRSAFPGKLLVLNPGSPLCSSFSGTADIFLFAEGSSSFFNSGDAQQYYASPDFNWIRDLPNNQVWVINYGVDSGSIVSQTDKVSTDLGAGIVWMSNFPTTNDYNKLPPSDYLSILSNRANGGTTVGASSSAPAVAAAPVTPVAVAPVAVTPVAVTAAPTTTAAPATVAPTTIATTTTVAGVKGPVVTAPPVLTATSPTTPTPTAPPVVTTAPAPAPTTTAPPASAAPAVGAPVADAVVGSPHYTG